MEKILDWLEQPFSEDMNAAQWGLFIGLVLLFLFAWSRVINMMG